MKILFTGSYEAEYNRNKIIMAGLKKLDHEVLEYSFKKKSSADKALLKSKINDADVIYLPAFTHREVSFVKKLAPQKPLIFDPLVSRYMTKVLDYKLVSTFSISALRNYYRDKWSLEAADFVVTDTQAHLDYFHETFGVPKAKMGPLYIGNNFADYFPVVRAQAISASRFKVGFYGGFIPLQGVSQILEAARLLRERTDIVFELIGSGFEYEQAQDFVRRHGLLNVSMPGWVNQLELPALIDDFDLALGIFGETVKADLVIPNKIYHYAACAKPILTKRSSALSEVFTDQKDLVMIDTKPETIVQWILKLKENSQQRNELGQAAYGTVKNNFSEVHIAQKLVDYFALLLK